jgi:hypothetical protein
MRCFIYRDDDRAPSCRLLTMTWESTWLIMLFLADTLGASSLELSKCGEISQSVFSNIISWYKVLRQVHGNLEVAGLYELDNRIVRTCRETDPNMFFKYGSLRKCLDAPKIYFTSGYIDGTAILLMTNSAVSVINFVWFKTVENSPVSMLCVPGVLSPWKFTEHTPCSFINWGKSMWDNLLLWSKLFYFWRRGMHSSRREKLKYDAP